ncbi:17S U2 SnRNP complex component HTATSF1-like isoform X3 [Littorina saxatilis]|uniref:17S U2 SnRNP complex component HTATSF1-like isoform X3 n=1 Tax=Littorina saxatilis TaxID=31220 RepID=UPI0038B68DEB
MDTGTNPPGTQDHGPDPTRSGDATEQFSSIPDSPTGVYGSDYQYHDSGDKRNQQVQDNGSSESPGKKRKVSMDTDTSPPGTQDHGPDQTRSGDATEQFSSIPDSPRAVYGSSDYQYHDSGDKRNQQVQDNGSSESPGKKRKKVSMDTDTSPPGTQDHGPDQTRSGDATEQFSSIPDSPRAVYGSDYQYHDSGDKRNQQVQDDGSSESPGKKRKKVSMDTDTSPPGTQDHGPDQTRSGDATEQFSSIPDSPTAVYGSDYQYHDSGDKRNQQVQDDGSSESPGKKVSMDTDTSPPVTQDHGPDRTKSGDATEQFSSIPDSPTAVYSSDYDDSGDEWYPPDEGSSDSCGTIWTISVDTDTISMTQDANERAFSNTPACSSAPSSEKYDVSVETRTGNQKKWDKKHYCKFCNTLKTKLSAHLQNVHKNELEVAAVVALPKNSKERKEAFGKLQNDGDNEHNANVLRKGSGCLIPKYRGKNRNVDECLACPHCKGLYLKALLSKHMKTCP